MTGSEIIKADSQEEAVVQQFIQASRDIIPTVEVSLAKRIVRPGSNRVLCLAAHTSIPLSETDIASVSDLALKLSDGTNVRLSLSFFNDATCNDLIPSMPSIPTIQTFQRTVYDPHRYERQLHKEPKFSLVFTSMAVLAASGLFFVCPQAMELIQPLLEPLPVKTAKSSVAPIQSHNVTVAKKTPSTKVVSEQPQSPEVGKKEASGSKSRQTSRSSKRIARHNSGSKTVASAKSSSSPQSHHKASAGGRRESFLIPPPPPVAVSFPEYSSYPFVPEFKAPPMAVKAGQYQTVPNAPPLVRTKLPPISMNDGRSSYRKFPPPPAEISSNTIPDVQPVRPLPGFDELIAATQASRPVRRAQMIQRTPVLPSDGGDLTITQYSATDVAGKSAPAPGYQQMERITLPNQSQEQQH